MAETETPGLSTMVIAIIIDLVQNLVILGLYITALVNGSHKFRLWVIKRDPTFVIVSILSGVYLLVSFVGSIFLIYAAALKSDLKKCMKICLRWLIFRALSFIIPVAFLIGVGGDAMITTCALTMLMWFVTLLFVATYYFNVSEYLDDLAGIKPKSATVENGDAGRRSRNIHRPTSKVKPINQAPGELTEEHLRQLEQFQAYVRRTSWCSWSDEGGGGPPSSRASAAHSTRF